MQLGGQRGHHHWVMDVFRRGHDDGVHTAALDHGPIVGVHPTHAMLGRQRLCPLAVAAAHRGQDGTRMRRQHRRQEVLSPSTRPDQPNPNSVRHQNLPVTADARHHGEQLAHVC